MDDPYGAPVRNPCRRYFVPPSRKLCPSPFAFEKKFLCASSKVGFSFSRVQNLDSPRFLVRRWSTAHHHAQRDNIVRGSFCTSEVKQKEPVQWQREARAVLLACKQQDLAEEEQEKVEVPQKSDRFSALSG